MERGKKHLSFVSWKKHKLEEALGHVDLVLDGIIDDLIFREVMNVMRTEYGYPGALPVDVFTDARPIFPRASFSFPSATIAAAEEKCVCCGRSVTTKQYLNHFLTCAKELDQDRIRQILIGPFNT